MEIYTNPTSYRDPSWTVVTSLASLREQTPPSYVGNTLGSTARQTYPLCLVLGSAGTIGTNAGIYVWDASSAVADNNSTVIKPDAPQVGGNPGRWVRVGSAL